MDPVKKMKNQTNTNPIIGYAGTTVETPTSISSGVVPLGNSNV